ncbi:ABC transporter permease subunit [Lactiplantibacillus plantarum]|uniref:ABC transporter permease subunit n=1 Tax=Lactiplantibacillus plantarum TaxID=1590 RepID=UPI00280B9CEB|nr:ABC transporter permease subunit [Lactiplantibacillus plantarum]
MSSWAVIQQSLPMFGEKGFQLTLWLSFVGIIGSIIVGIIVSLLQYFKVPVLHQVVSIYVEVSRNTPLLIQLFFLYYAFPVIGIKFGAELCGIIGLIFLGGSYMAEGFTGGFNGVSKGQLESGKANRVESLAACQIHCLPTRILTERSGNGRQCVFLIKETSIFTVIAIPELTNTALDLIGMYYRSNEYLLVLVVGYAIILIPLSIILTLLEKRVRYGSFGN